MNAIDAYIDKQKNFAELLSALRNIMAKTELVETVKWGIPTYTLAGKNVVGLAAFKAHCSLWFYQGALLKDPAKILINAQEGKTIAQRQWRFTEDAPLDEPLILSYIQEAIANEKQGLRVPIPKKPLKLPKLLKDRLVKQQLLERFEALSLSERRIYSEHIESAKRDDTKLRRLEKIIPMIEQGLGLHDKYKKC